MQLRIGAFISVLSRYPADVIRDVLDPFNGIVGKTNFLPSAFEVRVACDAIYLPQLRAAERDREIKDQLAERKEREQSLLTRVSSGWWDEQKADLAAKGFQPFLGGTSSGYSPTRSGIVSSAWGAMMIASSAWRELPSTVAAIFWPALTPTIKVGTMGLTAGSSVGNT